MSNYKVGKIDSSRPVKYVSREESSKAYQANQPLFHANTLTRDKKAVLNQNMLMEGKTANKINYVA